MCTCFRKIRKLYIEKQPFCTALEIERNTEKRLGPGRGGDAARACSTSTRKTAKPLYKRVDETLRTEGLSISIVSQLLLSSSADTGLSLSLFSLPGFVPLFSSFSLVLPLRFRSFSSERNLNIRLQDFNRCEIGLSPKCYGGAVDRGYPEVTGGSFFELGSLVLVWGSRPPFDPG